MFNEYVCSCAQCVSMCERSPCIPTPEEAVNLIKLGYGNRMVARIYGNYDGAVIYPARKGDEGKPMQETATGACTFLKNGLCELHDKGLKPMEGRAEVHSAENSPIHEYLINEWKKPEALALLSEFVNNKCAK